MGETSPGMVHARTGEPAPDVANPAVRPGLRRAQGLLAPELRVPSGPRPPAFGDDDGNDPEGDRDDD